MSIRPVKAFMEGVDGTLRKKVMPICEPCALVRNMCTVLQEWSNISESTTVLQRLRIAVGNMYNEHCHTQYEINVILILTMDFATPGREIRNY